MKKLCLLLFPAMLYYTACSAVGNYSGGNTSGEDILFILVLISPILLSPICSLIAVIFNKGSLKSLGWVFSVLAYIELSFIGEHLDSLSLANAIPVASMVLLLWQTARRADNRRYVLAYLCLIFAVYQLFGSLSFVLYFTLRFFPISVTHYYIPSAVALIFFTVLFYQLYRKFYYRALRRPTLQRAILYGAIIMLSTWAFDAAKAYSLYGITKSYGYSFHPINFFIGTVYGGTSVCQCYCLPDMEMET